MPIQYYAGKPSPRVTDPPLKGVANARGTYPWTTFYARLSYLDAGEVKASSGFVNGALGAEVKANLLLFLADIPGIAQLKCYHSDATNSPRLNDVTNELGLPFLFTTSGGIVEVALANVGQVAIGYAGAGSTVRVSGFPAKTYFRVAGNAAQTTDEASILVWGNGGIASPVSQNRDAGSPIAPQPIVLLQSDYTQAIKDNGNLIAFDKYLYLVVGLHDAAQPA